MKVVEKLTRLSKKVKRKFQEEKKIIPGNLWEGTMKRVTKIRESARNKTKKVPGKYQERTGKFLGNY